MDVDIFEEAGGYCFWSYWIYDNSVALFVIMTGIVLTVGERGPSPEFCVLLLKVEKI